MSSADPSDALTKLYTSNDLFWNGKKGVEANSGVSPQLYAPVNGVKVQVTPIWMRLLFRLATRTP